MNSSFGHSQGQPSSGDRFTVQRLTPEEINNPYLVLEDFFAIGHLPEIREKLWDFFRATITGSFSDQMDNVQRAQIVSLYEYLERLIEAVYLVNEKQLNLRLNSLN